MKRKEKRKRYICIYIYIYPNLLNKIVHILKFKEKWFFFQGEIVFLLKRNGSTKRHGTKERKETTYIHENIFV